MLRNSTEVHDGCIFRFCFFQLIYGAFYSDNLNPATIDVSCIDIANEAEFNGNPVIREKVDMKLETYLNSMVSISDNKSHCIDEAQLHLYLS